MVSSDSEFAIDSRHPCTSFFNLQPPTWSLTHSPSLLTSIPSSWAMVVPCVSDYQSIPCPCCSDSNTSKVQGHLKGFKHKLIGQPPADSSREAAKIQGVAGVPISFPTPRLHGQALWAKITKLLQQWVRQNSTTLCYTSCWQPSVSIHIDTISIPKLLLSCSPQCTFGKLRLVLPWSSQGNEFNVSQHSGVTLLTRLSRGWRLSNCHLLCTWLSR